MISQMDTYQYALYLVGTFVSPRVFCGKSRSHRIYFYAYKDQFSKLLDRIRNTEIQLDTFERANQKQEATIVKLRKTNRQLEWDLEREKLQENCSTWRNFVYRKKYLFSFFSNVRLNFRQVKQSASFELHEAGRNAKTQKQK